MIKRCLSILLAGLAVSAVAAPPSADDLAACQIGAAHGRTQLTEISFQTLTEEDDYWKGYTATTVIFNGKTLGYARKDQEQGIAFNGRVYPLRQAKLINLSREEFNDQLGRGIIGIIQAADWYWLKGRHQFLCIATNQSMEMATPVLVLLSMDRPHQVYVAVGKSPNDGNGHR